MDHTKRIARVILYKLPCFLLSLYIHGWCLYRDVIADVVTVCTHGWCLCRDVIVIADVVTVCRLYCFVKGEGIFETRSGIRNYNSISVPSLNIKSCFPRIWFLAHDRLKQQYFEFNNMCIQLYILLNVIETRYGTLEYTYLDMEVNILQKTTILSADLFVS